MKNIKMITVTGGPCGGKTSLLSRLSKEIDEKFPDWYLMIIPETASELILGGIRPFGNCMPLLRFQRYVLEKQMAKENLYLKAAQEVPNDNVLIVCDRGLCDNIAYCDNDECSAEEMFERLLEVHKKTLSDARDRYDLVIHLVTAAIGTDAYTTENNSARYESPEEAVIADNKTLAAWIGHPNLKIIDNTTNFQDKLDRAMAEIHYIMGLKDTIEYHKKLLVEIPDLNLLPEHKKITIVQNYLHSDDENVEKRIRQRSYRGNSSYYYTEKNAIDNDDSGRLKKERRITEREYLSLLSQIDPEYRQIVKNRYCFVYENQYMNLDVFTFDNTKALLEVSLKRADEGVEFPEFIKAIKDVTYDKDYNNISLSRTLKFK